MLGSFSLLLFEEKRDVRKNGTWEKRDVLNKTSMNKCRRDIPVPKILGLENPHFLSGLENPPPWRTSSSYTVDAKNSCSRFAATAMLLLLIFSSLAYASVIYDGGLGDGAAFCNLLYLNSRPDLPQYLGQIRSDNSNPINWAIWTNDLTPKTTFYLTDPDEAGTVRYQIQVSTDSGFAVTTIDYTSTLIDQGTTNYIMTGLSSGSSYYWRVMTIDTYTYTSGWSTANAGGIAVKIDTISPVSVGFDTVYVSSSTIIITTGTATDAVSGLAEHPYYIQRSTDSGFAPAATSSSGWVASSHTWTGLNPNTTYYFRLKAKDNAGNESGFASPATKATRTTVPAGVSATGISSSTIQISWTGDGAEYFVQWSTKDTGEWADLLSGWIQAATTAQMNLTPNLERWYKVKARNHVELETAYCAAVQGYTQSIMPAADDPWVTDVFKSSAVVHWLANGNAAGTNYQAAVSTNADFSPALSTMTWTEDVFVTTFTALSSNTSYYFRVRAKGAEGSASNWCVFGSTWTLIPQIVNREWQIVTSSIGIKSADSFNNLSQGQSGLRYWCYVDSNYSEWKASSTWIKNQDFWYAEGLETNATYYFRLKSRNGSGIETAALETSTGTAIETVSSLEFTVWSSSIGATAFNPEGFSTLTAGESGIEYYVVNKTTGSSWRQTTSYWWFDDWDAGLTPGKAYTFKARSRNNKKYTNEWSAEVTTYTLCNAPNVSEIDIESVANKDSEIKVKIDKNGNDAIVNYAIAASSDAWATTYYVNASSEAVSASPCWDTYAGWGGLSGVKVTGLASNEEWNFKIKAKNGNDVETDFSGALSTATYLPTPAGISYETVGSTYVRVSPTGTFDNLGEGVSAVSVWKFGDSANWVADTDVRQINSLTPNTTHTFYAQSRNRYGNSFDAYEEEKLTLAAVPGYEAVTVQSTGSAKCEWTENSNDLNTEYLVVASTAADYSVYNSSSGWFDPEVFADYTFADLSANVKYYFGVKARNFVFEETDWRVLDSSYTLIENAECASWGTITTNSIYLQAFPEPSNLLDGGMVFRNATNATNSGWITDNEWSCPDLSSNTLYNFYIKTKNGNGIINSETGPFTKATRIETPTGVEFDTETVTYNSISTKVTGLFTNLSSGDSAVNVYCQTKSSGVWSGETGYREFTGLSPNVTYYFVANSRNYEGVLNSSSAVYGIHTLCVVPSSPTIKDQGTDYIKVAINSAGTTPENPDPDTEYVIAVSTAGFTAGTTYYMTSSDGPLDTAETWGTRSYWGNDPGAKATGLTLNTRYWFKVKAKNKDGVETAYGNPADCYTLGNAPALTVTATSTKTIHLAWTNTASDYWVQYSTCTPANWQDFSGGGWHVILSTDDTGLTPNVEMRYRVKGKNAEGTETAWNSDDPVKKAVTLANPPTGSQFDGVFQSSVTLSWGINSNPGYTRYGLSYSTKNDFSSYVSTPAVFASGLTANTTSVKGLNSNTTYYFRTWAYNGDEIMTSFDTTISTLTHSGEPPDTTPPCAISNLTALTGDIAGEIKLKWTAPGEDGIGGGNATSYEVKCATKYIDTGDYNANWTSIYTQSWIPAAPGSEESQILSGFSEGVTYWFAIKAYDGANWSSWTSSGTVSWVNKNNSSWAKINSVPNAPDMGPTTDTGQFQNDGTTSIAVGGEASSTTVVFKGMVSDPDSDTVKIEVEIRRKGTAFFNAATHGGSLVASGSTQTIIVSGLTQSATYHWQARTVDSNSAVSAWTNFDSGAEPNHFFVFPSTYGGLLPSTLNQWHYGFEGGSVSDDPNWEELGTASGIDNVGSIVRSGNRSCRFSDLTTAYSGREILSATCTVTAGSSYRVGIWCYVSTTTLGVISDVQFELGIRWYDAGDVFLSEDKTTGIILSSYDAWEQIKYENVKAPAGATQGRFLVGAQETNNLNYDPRIDDAQFLKIQDTTSPDAVTNLAGVTGTNEGEIDLSWTAPGDDGTTGNIVNGKFAIQYSTYVVSWSTSSAQITKSTSTTAQEAQSYTVTGLIAGITHYFRIWIADEVPNWSEISNGATAWAQVDVTVPAAVTGFTASAGAQVSLSWVAPGDDDYSGDVTGGKWQIKYSSTVGSTPDTAEYSVEKSSSWTESNTYIEVITGLKPRTTYYFWIRARDENESNWSVWSDTKTAVSGSFFLYQQPSGSGGFAEGGVSWGDFDNDGDLDLAVNGRVGSGSWDLKFQVYRNDGGNFVFHQEPAKAGGEGGNVCWGDFDNDGDLDLAVTGWDGSFRRFRVYRNEGGNFVMHQEPSGTNGPNSGVSWGDYDNDGDLDLAVTGYDGSGYRFRIYRNDNDNFVLQQEPALDYSQYGTVSWGDFDNDGDLDLVVNGRTYAGGPWRLRVFRNDSGNFVLHQEPAGANGPADGGVSWGDYDNDGDLDLAVNGYDGSGYRFRIYRNDNGTFNLASEPAGATGPGNGSVSWGDYDNDGDLDLAVNGYDGSGYRFRIYRNDNGTFNLASEPAGATGPGDGGVSWGDFDNDGDLDLAVNGYDGSGRRFRIYKSLEADFGNANTVPSAPSSGFSSQLAGNSLQLRWDKGTDTEIGADTKGLYYDIRIATESITDNLDKWLVSPSTGTGVPNMGNYPHGFCVASSTQPGLNLDISLENVTYYWQVKTIDTGLKKSAWSVQQSTYVSEAPTVPILSSPSDNWTTNQLTITFNWSDSTDAISGMSNYELQVSTDVNFNVINYSSSPIISQASLTTTSDKFYWRVRAKDNAGNYSNWTSTYSITVDTTPPVTVGFQTIVASSSTIIITTGTAMDALSGLDSQPYYIEAGTSPATTEYNSGWVASSHTFTGLNPNTTYYFRLKARDKAGNESVYCSTQTKVTLCSPPDSPAWQNVYISSITVTWGTVESPANPDDTVYIVQLSTASDWTGTIKSSSTVRSSQSAVVSGLTPNTTYYGRVKAENWEGIATNWVELPAVLTKIEEPAGISFAVDTDSITVTAQGSYTNISLGESGIKFWNLTSNTSSQWQKTFVWTSTGLQPAKSYTFRIKARNQAGSETGYIDVSTPTHANEPGLNDLVILGTGTIKAQWTTNNNVTAEYFAEVSTVNYGGLVLDESGWGSIVNYTFNGLEANKKHYFRVKARNGANIETNYVNLGSSWTKIENPTGLSFEASITSITVTALGMMTNLGDGISGIEFQKGNDSSFLTGVSSTGWIVATSTAFKNLSPNVTYYFRARTRNGDGNFVNDFITEQAKMTLANAPTGSYVVSRSSNSVTIAWSNNSNPSYTRWGIVRSTDNFVSSSTLKGFADNYTNVSFTDTDLANEATYYYRVRAFNEDGIATSYDVVISTYLPDTIAPGKVTGFSAATGAQVSLSWVAPGDDGYSGSVTGGEWQINYSSTAFSTPDTAENTQAEACGYQQGNVYTKTITGLKPRTTYYFWIKAQDENDGQWSTWSDTKTAISGSFVDLQASIINVSRCSLAWGDYDNDGDLDLVIGGYTDSGAITKIYRNDNGNFVDIEANLSGIGGLGKGSLSWGDYDNDGDLDIALAGCPTLSGSAAVSKIYRNDSGNFVDISAGLVGVYYSSLAWGDYDNDGDLDLVMAGYNVTLGKIAKIYRNDMGAFVDINAALTGGHSGSLAWGDYDNDGDLDLAFTGSAVTPVRISKIYRNDANTFVDIDAGLTGLESSSLAWGDYDNDGDLDLILTGWDGFQVLLKIYRNDSNNFIDIAAGLNGSHYCSLAWGDYDNDGDLDGIISATSKIYRNDSNNFVQIESGLPSVLYSDLAWGDYDNDGDLDLILAGGGGFISKIYKSLEADSGNTNVTPTVPTNLTANYNEQSSALQLRWDKGTDTEIGDTKGLYYDVRVATESITDNLNKWIVSPSTGAGVPNFGNYPHGFVVAASTQAGLNLSNGLLEGSTYYWQVRTIDTGLKKSAWTAQQSTLVPNIPPTVPVLISPVNGATTNYATVTFDWGNSTDAVSGVDIYELNLATETNFNSVSYSSIPFSSQASLTVAENVYYWRARAKDNVGNYSAWSSTRLITVDTSPPVSVGFQTITASSSTIIITTGTATDALSGLANQPYYIEAGTSPATTEYSSGWVASFHTWIGLSTNIMYYFRITAKDAIGNESVWSSTYTKATRIETVSGSQFAVGSSSMGIRTTDSMTNLADGDSAIWYGCYTNSNYTGLAASTWTKNTTYWWADGLSVNTTYYWKANSRNYDGLLNSSVTFGAKYTLANTPSTATLTVLSAPDGRTKIKVQADYGDNPAATLMAIAVSTDNFSSDTRFIWYDGGDLTYKLRINPEDWREQFDWGGGTGFNLEGLTANTTYQFKVKARNGDGIETGFSAETERATRTTVPEGAFATGTSSSTIQINWSGDGSEYFVQWSTKSTGEWADLLSDWITADTTAQMNLTPNLERWYKVKARNHAEVETAYCAAVQGYTQSIMPAADIPWVTDVFKSSAVVHWLSNGNAAGTNYQAAVSTNSDFAPALSTTSFAVDMFLTTFTALSSNASYYFRVRSSGTAGVASNWCNLGSTWTLANPPKVLSGGLSIEEKGLDYIKAAWDENNNSSAADYWVEASTIGYGGTISTGALSAHTTYHFLNLAPNASYYIQVKALNGAGISTDFTQLGSSWTLIEPVTGISFEGIYESSVTFSVQGGPFSNIGKGLSGVKLGVYNDAAYSDLKAETTWAVPTSTTTMDLSPNTTYYFTANSRNGEAVENTAQGKLGNEIPKATKAAEAGGLSYSTVTSTSIKVIWGASTPVNNPADTLYRVELATSSNFGGNIKSSQTIRLLNGAAVGNLSANVTYYCRVKTINRVGVETTVNFGTKVTLCSSPAGLAWGGIATQSLAVTWGASSPDNSADTVYIVELATASDFTGTIKSSQTIRAAASAAPTGLEANTTYYGRVIARNRIGIEVAANLSPACKVTLCAAPDSPAWGSAHISSVTVTWGTAESPANPDGTVYIVELATSSDFTGTIKSSQTIRAAASASLTGLDANTTYYARVSARNRVGEDASTNLSPTSKATLCSAPDSLAWGAVFVTSMTVTWGTAESPANPGDTIYIVELSTSSDFGGVIKSSQATRAAASAIVSALSANVTYYARVVARNRIGEDASTDLSPGKVTLCSAPDSPAWGAVFLTSMTVTWGTAESPVNPDDTVYIVQLSTASDFTGVIKSSQTTRAAASAVPTGLEINTRYYARVTARNRAGEEITANLSPVWKSTLANPPINLTLNSADTDRINLSWDINSNPGWTKYGVAVSTDDFVLHISTAVDFDNGLTANTTAVGSLYEGATYYLKAFAYNGDEINTDYSNKVSTVTPRIAPAAVTDLYGVPGGEEGQIKLSWTATGDDGLSGNIEGGKFRIFYSTLQAQAEACGYEDYEIEIATTNLAPLSSCVRIITGLKPSSTYYFVIWSCDEVLNWSEGSAVVSSYALDLPPEAPGGVNIEVPPYGEKLYLSWDANTESDINAYRIYRSLTAGFTEGGDNYIVTKTHPVTAYSDGGLINGEKYYYKIVAVDDMGNTSGASAEASGVPAEPKYGVSGRIDMEGYADNYKELSGFESDEFWNPASYDTADYREGESALKLTSSNGAAEQSERITQVLNLSALENIEFWVKVSDAGSLANAKVRLCSDVNGTMYYEYSVSGLSSGWNFVNTAKALWAETGSASWSNIVRVEVEANSKAGQWI